ncbi:MAG: internal scaffolding protein [Microviridae sp.]|nr:MAG: internal scaffolding protein [Microviridae sp.]
MSYNPNNPRPLIPTQKHLTSNYSPKLRIQLTFPENSLYTKQEFKEECDINYIMNQYQQTGLIPNLNEIAPQYLEDTDFDFRSSMEYIAEAKSLFNQMPSKIRAQFDNDPATFLDFCSKEKNRPELAEMGLLKPESEWVQITLSEHLKSSNKQPSDKGDISPPSGSNLAES